MHLRDEWESYNPAKKTWALGYLIAVIAMWLFVLTPLLSSLSPWKWLAGIVLAICAVVVLIAHCVDLIFFSEESS